MWYSPVDTLNKQRLFNMDIGARGCGKTTGAIRYIIDQHIKNTNYEAVWVRRYKEERNEIEKTFFDSIVNKNFYPNHEFKTRAHIGYMDGVPIIRFAALSVDKRRKGITSPNVRLMVFDEFLLDKGDRYIPDEFTAFLSFYDTIARPADQERERVPVYTVWHNYANLVIRIHSEFFHSGSHTSSSDKKIFIGEFTVIYTKKYLIRILFSIFFIFLKKIICHLIYLSFYLFNSLSAIKSAAICLTQWNCSPTGIACIIVSSETYAGLSSISRLSL